MIGSPYYYDVLFDDGPGDVVFHDCMWSGICTCCIQLLHQDSYYQLTNESPDLKVEDLNNHQSALDNLTVASATATTTTSSNGTSTLDPRIMRLTQSHHGDSNTYNNNNNNNNNEPYQRSVAAAAARHSHSPNLKYDIKSPLNDKLSLHQQRHSSNNNLDSTTTTINDPRTMPASATAISPNSHHLEQQYQHHHTSGRFLDPNSASDLNTVVVRSASSSNRNSPDNSNSSSSLSSSTTSSASSSTSTSPKPLRRREHNDSERKRRDHLRNAFNFLRDQVPRFKAMNKKPPRIQILHEATKYVQCIMRESIELERRLDEERAKHARLKLQSNE